jgi:orotate phosphoribosyltransferase
VKLETESVIDLFRSTGAYLEGHFRLTSGLHSPNYLQSALVLRHPEQAEKLGRLLAEELRGIVKEPIAVVVSPALGGVIIGHEVARALGVPFLFTEREPATRQMLLRRGFSVQPGETAVIVEDVITTGGSTVETIEVMRAHGARVLAAGSIMDRSGGRADVSVPRVALATLEVAAYPADDCPLCRQGLPVVKPGSRPA